MDTFSTPSSSAHGEGNPRKPIVTQTRRRLALNAFFMRFGHHPAAWRHPSAIGNGRPDVGYWVRLAQIAEAAKFDTYFIADFIGRSADKLEQLSSNGLAFQFEPLTLLSAIALHTRAQRTRRDGQHQPQRTPYRVCPIVAGPATAESSLARVAVDPPSRARIQRCSSGAHLPQVRYQGVKVGRPVLPVLADLENGKTVPAGG